eukprot:TRINITY_DN2838_c0_g2_i2.p1 TRINITY_DN2838_c0_g2~~TRINITY_DN2838_c0_g2_i2.p1  ORF type:complete len:417 (-),score=80.94 TRINITY_DN2838_c0_g2_i2:56-1219(-)
MARGGGSSRGKDGLRHEMSCWVAAADASWGVKSKTLPNAALMYPREFDKSFGDSLAGMIWPRAAVSAAALWHYDEKISADAATENAAWLAAQLRRSGVSSCPPGCACDELSACDVPYAVRFGGAPAAKASAIASATEAAELRDDRDLEACFRPGLAADVASAAGPDDEAPKPLRDALRSCFWRGAACAALLCAPPWRSRSEAYSSAAATPSDGSAVSSEPICRARMAQTQPKPPTAGQALPAVDDASHRAALRAASVLLKRMDVDRCAPFNAWSQQYPSVIATSAAAASVTSPPPPPPRLCTERQRLSWDRHEQKFLGGYVGKPTTMGLSVAQQQCLLHPKCRGVTCEGATAAVAVAGQKCTLRLGDPMLAATPSGAFEVSHLWRCV